MYISLSLSFSPSFSLSFVGQNYFHVKKLIQTLLLRWIPACDGFGIPKPKRSSFFLKPKIQLKDPKSIARKHALREKKTVFPKSTCRFLHPDFGIFSLNPRVVVGYCLSEGAEICTLT